jgi:hypothetical protein
MTRRVKQAAAQVERVIQGLEKQKNTLAELAAALSTEKKPVPSEVGEALGAIEMRLRWTRKAWRVLQSRNHSNHFLARRYINAAEQVDMTSVARLIEKGDEL